MARRKRQGRLARIGSYLHNRIERKNITKEVANSKYNEDPKWLLSKGAAAFMVVMGVVGVINGLQDFTAGVLLAWTGIGLGLEEALAIISFIGGIISILWGGWRLIS